MKRDLLIGAHMSIEGGIYKAFERGHLAGCRTLQIFLKNSNRWKAKALSEDDRLLYRVAQKKTGIDPVVAHISYLVNLASPESSLWKKSIEAFIEEMERAHYLSVPCVILHPGAHMGAGEQEGMRRTADALKKALAEVAPPVRILLENTAGQGSSIGHRIEQLAAILDFVPDSERIGICLDTCHLFAAGYDIRDEEGYLKTIDAVDRLIGISRIGAFHVNDCKKDLGSRIDRHEHIGRGLIGLEGFRALVNDSRFVRTPKILETPKGKDLKEDKINLATLRGLIVKGAQVGHESAAHPKKPDKGF
jgi:deoxyribonuclease IV